MPGGISLQRDQAILPCTGHCGGDASVDLRAIDFSNARAVELARGEILGMRAWDSIPDSLFHHGARQQALHAITQKVLCEQAAIWQEANPQKQPVESLSPRARLHAQNTFLTLLSPQGALAMMDARNAFLSSLPEEEDQLTARRYTAVPGGFRFHPEFGDPVVNDLMGIVVTHDEAVDSLMAAGNYDAAAILRFSIRRQDGDDPQATRGCRLVRQNMAAESGNSDDLLLEYIAMNHRSRPSREAIKTGMYRRA